jgi:hypothetical protein
MVPELSRDLVLSLAMLSVAALIGGSIVLFRRGEDRKRAILMFVAALVLLGNVLIWQ